ncbi:glutamate-gated chloride channel-like [Branchiostoma floridae x Branchiostoma japonicum]
MWGCSHGNECAVCRAYFGSCRYNSNVCKNSNTSGLTEIATLAVRLQFSRRLHRHVFMTFLPTTSVVMTSWLGFWLHPKEVNARVQLGVTTLLSLVIKSSKDENPRTNLVRAYDVWMGGCLVMALLEPTNLVRAYDVWMAGCLVMAMLALLETVLVNYISAGGQLPVGCSRWCPAWVEPLTRPSTAWVEEEENNLHSAERMAARVDFFARIVFPVMFVAFLIGFFTYYA